MTPNHARSSYWPISASQDTRWPKSASIPLRGDIGHGEVKTGPENVRNPTLREELSKLATNETNLVQDTSLASSVTGLQTCNHSTFRKGLVSKRLCKGILWGNAVTCKQFQHVAVLCHPTITKVITSARCWMRRLLWLCSQAPPKYIHRSTFALHFSCQSCRCHGLHVLQCHIRQKFIRLALQIVKVPWTLVEVSAWDLLVFSTEGSMPWVLLHEKLISWTREPPKNAPSKLT